ncbi:MAG: radical SAM protein [Desulfuromonadales bacterium]|nr:radical SAM protein [Desulfuromonadales bacterium]
MTILLAYISGDSNRDDPFISLLPCGLCYLHSTLREAGFDSLLANFSGWLESDVSRQLNQLRPDIIAISQWTHNRHASLDLALLARRLNPCCTIIMGGGHASFQVNEVLCPGSPVDLVLVGEGEETMLELVRHLEAGSNWNQIRGIAFRNGDSVITTEPRKLLEELDSLPFASRYLDHSLGVDCELQAEFIVTARGCPSACNFCSSPGFWRRRVRFRSPENIVDEILFVRERYGLLYFSLRDDTFTADRARTISFCRLLIERRAHIVWNCQSRVNSLDDELLVWMKRAGCECVQLGVESGSPRILKLLGKTITPDQVMRAAVAVRKIGINLSVYMISDVPGETDADRDASIALMRRIRPDDGYVSPLAYYPGTKLFYDAVANGRIGERVFQESRAPAVYAVGRPGRSSQRLLRALDGQHAKGGRELKRLKHTLGYCHATNVMAGEYFRQVGDCVAAEREFREIVEQEPDNPWGWFLLGELLSEQGHQDRAAKCFRRVLDRVPCHSPSRLALGL